MSTIADLSGVIPQLTTVVERAVSDPAYRSALIQSTTGTLQSAGIFIPAGLDVRVAENTDEIRHLVLYAKPPLSSGDAQQLAALLNQASAPTNALDGYAKLTLDSWSDSQLRPRLQTDGASVLAQYGISLPTGTRIEPLEASNSLAWLTLPPATTSSAGTSGATASNVTSSFANLVKLITASSYLAGLAFSIASIFKFKQHKDTPASTQVPVVAPVALMVVSVAFLTLPSVTE